MKRLRNVFAFGDNFPLPEFFIELFIFLRVSAGPVSKTKSPEEISPLPPAPRLFFPPFEKGTEYRKGMLSFISKASVELRCFVVVTGFAQGLVIAWIPEQF
jgi:hypothetical protein